MGMWLSMDRWLCRGWNMGDRERGRAWMERRGEDSRWVDIVGTLCWKWDIA